MKPGGSVSIRLFIVRSLRVDSLFVLVSGVYEVVPPPQAIRWAAILTI